MTVAPIAEVETIVLRARDGDGADLDGSSETAVVRIVDEEGRSGIGEADAPAEVVREFVAMDDAHAWSRGLGGLLLGRDPFEIGRLHGELYEATIYHGRRGIGIHALSAVDVALHALAGKQVGRPAYQLLGGPPRGADAVRDRPRVPRVARARAGRSAPAGRQPLRRAHRAVPDRGARGAARRQRYPTRLEDGHHGGGAAPLSGGDAERVLDRDVPPGALRVDLRRELTSPEPAVVCGKMPLPAEPGLGVTLDEQVVERLRAGG